MLLVVALLPRDADWYSLDYWLDRRRAARAIAQDV
jgi:hypothetical protein